MPLPAILCALALALCLLTGCGDEISAPDSVPVSGVSGTTATSSTTTASSTAATTTTTATETAAPRDGKTLPAGTRITEQEAADLSAFFTAEPIPDAVFARMDGVSYHENDQITREDLRYLRLLHFTPDGGRQIGEMVCNSAIAQDLLEIFRALYDAAYPIEQMLLVDSFGGDDERSMAANNTSCFNYRTVAGKTALSNHARGLAVDINPFYNPYITQNPDGSQNIAPAGSEPFAARDKDFEMKIARGDLCYTLFIQHGFTWGGDWSGEKDYQHFEKP